MCIRDSNGGLGEIVLPAVQKGSTIMPGKINPVIPEMMCQVSLKVMANDSTISLSAALGNLELNQFAPLITHSILESLQILKNSIKIFNASCVVGITANADKCMQNLKQSKTLATVLVPILGYEKVEKIIFLAKERNCDIEKLIIEENLLTEEELKKLLAPNAMYKMGF